MDTAQFIISPDLKSIIGQNTLPPWFTQCCKDDLNLQSLASLFPFDLNLALQVLQNCPTWNFHGACTLRGGHDAASITGYQLTPLPGKDANQTMGTLLQLQPENPEATQSTCILQHYLRSYAHDIRTPISSVKESVSLVREGHVGPLTEVQQKCLKVAFEEIQRINQLVDENLVLFRSMPDSFIETFPNKNLFQPLLQHMALFLEKKQVQCQLEIPEWGFNLTNSAPFYNLSLVGILLSCLHQADPGTKVEFSGQFSATEIPFVFNVKSSRLQGMLWDRVYLEDKGLDLENYDKGRGLDPLLLASLRLACTCGARLNLEFSEKDVFQVTLTFPYPGNPDERLRRFFEQTLLDNLPSKNSVKTLWIIQSNEDSAFSLPILSKLSQLLVKNHEGLPLVNDTGKILFFCPPAGCEFSWEEAESHSEISSLLSAFCNSVSVNSYNLSRNIINIPTWIQIFCEPD